MKLVNLDPSLVLELLLVIVYYIEFVLIVLK